LKGEFGSSSKRYITPTVSGNDANCIEAERILNIRGEGDQEKTIIAIKTATNVSSLPVLSVTHISYRPYPELPACISVCPFETNTLPYGMDLEQFIRTDIFIL
jgi:hypothetical protein